MIAGVGKQLTLRAVARLADACNVGGEKTTIVSVPVTTPRWRPSASGSLLEDRYGVLSALHHKPSL